MSLFPFDKTTARRMKQKEFQRWSVGFGLFFGVISVGLPWVMWRNPRIFGVGAILFALSIGLFIVCLFGLRLRFSRQVALLETAILEIDGAYVTLKNSGAVIVTVPLNLTGYCSIKHDGVWIRAGDSQERQLYIPSSISGYEDIIVRVKPYVVIPKRPLHQMILISILFGGLGFILLWTLFGKEPEFGVAILGASVALYFVFYWFSVKQ